MYRFTCVAPSEGRSRRLQSLMGTTTLKFNMIYLPHSRTTKSLYTIPRISIRCTTLTRSSWMRNVRIRFWRNFPDCERPASTSSQLLPCINPPKTPHLQTRTPSAAKLMAAKEDEVSNPAGIRARKQCNQEAKICMLQNPRGDWKAS